MTERRVRKKETIKILLEHISCLSAPLQSRVLVYSFYRTEVDCVGQAFLYIRAMFLPVYLHDGKLRSDIVVICTVCVCVWP